MEFGSTFFHIYLTFLHHFLRRDLDIIKSVLDVISFSIVLLSRTVQLLPGCSLLRRLLNFYTSFKMTLNSSNITSMSFYTAFSSVKDCAALRRRAGHLKVAFRENTDHCLFHSCLLYFSSLLPLPPHSRKSGNTLFGFCHVPCPPLFNPFPLFGFFHPYVI